MPTVEGHYELKLTGISDINRELVKTVDNPIYVDGTIINFGGLKGGGGGFELDRANLGQRIRALGNFYEKLGVGIGGGTAFGVDPGFDGFHHPHIQPVLLVKRQ